MSSHFSTVISKGWDHLSDRHTLVGWPEVYGRPCEIPRCLYHMHSGVVPFYRHQDDPPSWGNRTKSIARDHFEQAVRERDRENKDYIFPYSFSHSRELEVMERGYQG